MTCTACGHDNRAGRKFCVECGAALALACASCGTPHDAGERFCGECGAALGSGATPRAAASPATVAGADAGARKVVTVVFADLVGSTSLHERLDAESARRVMDRYYETLRTVVDAHGGMVVKLLGDGVMAAFGLHRVAEDDAVQAVRAAVAMQEAFRELVGGQAGLDSVGLRVGVNTGEVVVSGGEDDVVGDPVNVAARLQEQCRNGDVVIGETTRRLVATRVTLAPLGSVALKGRAEAVAAYRVESLESPPTATAAPFVGREAETARLLAIYDAAVAAQATRLAVLLGSPGLGKSRLVGEIANRVSDGATVLTAHCDAAGGATFAPLAAALRACLGIDAAAGAEAQRALVESALGNDSDRVRIAAGIVALLGGSPASTEETFFVVRRLLAALARRSPVVLVVDDVHWAEPLLLDLIEHLVQWGSGVPLFVLVGARPELREVRSSLVTMGGLVSEVVTLSGLDAGAAMRLAANVIGAADLPAAIAAKVLATSEGNPLFVGELVRMLVQEGALIKDGERWTAGAGLAAIEMPPTIHALLAARIERLRPEERAVLERASVVGRHFSRSAVVALLGRNGSELDARLESLRRSELIERDSGWMLGEPALRFHHVLIRDAAYRRLLKGTRAELHERLANWIEAQVGDAAEHDETIGRHLEQAHQHLRELASLDAHAKTLGERAATRLAAAGRRALARDDLPLAAGLLGRAIDRLDGDAAARAELALDWCEALLSAGDVAPAATAIDELGRFAESSDRLRAWHTCFRAQLAVMTAPEALHEAAERVATAARDLAAQGDAAGEAKAHFVHAQALARLGKVGDCEAALDQALAAARRAGDRRRANAVLAGAPLAALWGPSPVTRASGRCLDVVRVLRITQGAPAVEAVALSCQGVLEALRGRTDAARRMLASSRTMVEELGISQRLYEIDVFIARVDLLEGDAPAAERRLRAAYGGLRTLGLGIDAARAAALLARAMLAQGRAAEAEQVARESEQLAGDDLQAAILWRAARAEALAARGEHTAAVELAKAGVEIAAATDALLDHADARVALGAALRAAGRAGEAAAEERRAVELWEAKGATVLAERAGDFGSVAMPRVSAEVVAPVVEAVTAAGRVVRRVQPNFATEEARRVDAAVAARDTDALPGIWREDVKIVDHAHGLTYGHDEALERIRSMIDDAAGPSTRHEVLATLGASLALCRMRNSAAGATPYGLDVGPTEMSYTIVIEADEQARGVRVDMFLEDNLRAAVVCLYERYAESLPGGRERTRARGIAHSLSKFGGLIDAVGVASAHAASFSCVDHRILGTWSARSYDEWAKHWRWQVDLTTAFAMRDDDVLALDSSALLARHTFFGTSRESGGSFENVLLALNRFDEHGLIAGTEAFEPDQEAQALARFDELTGAGEGRAAFPPPRANIATRCVERWGVAIAARDGNAIGDMLDESLTVVHHATRATYGRREMLATWRSILKAERVSFRAEILASLGETLALDHHFIAVEGLSEAHLQGFGLAEFDEIVLFETDERGQLVRSEIFPAEQKQAAIERLHERYAELCEAEAM